MHGFPVVERWLKIATEKLFPDDVVKEENEGASSAGNTTSQVGKPEGDGGESSEAGKAGSG